MGAATRIDTAVQIETRSQTQLYRLDPPLIGDDGQAHSYGAAMRNPHTGVVDILAADHTGHIVTDQMGYVALRNSSLNRRAHRTTIADELAHLGYSEHD
ncbi:hypothetical protein [Nocardia sp. NPDC052566]|uniref:hypothetical protein n=1 Tax=Nocardia sp. NPDC052566 TaxID=3364330 RepID=UPI0037CA650B